MPDLTLSGVVPASGTVTLTLRPDNRRTWTIKQVGIDAPNVGPATCKITKNGNMVTPAIATGDAPSGEPFIEIGPSDVMQVTWAAGTVGAVVKATFFYDDGITHP